MPARLPDFLGIGTQKGGTTSLHRWLSKHPGVFMPKCKEIHYFSLQHHKMQKWYRKQFAEAEKEQICGEITPYYLFHPEAAKRIHKELPNIRLIVLLRDPIERTLSQISHSKRHGFEQLEAEQAIEQEDKRLQSGSSFSHQKHSYISRSRYIHQLDRYEMLFKPEQLLILKSEDLFEEPAAYWSRIQKFLALEDTGYMPKLEQANARQRTESKASDKLRQTLYEKLKPTAKEVKERYGISWGW